MSQSCVLVLEEVCGYVSILCVSMSQFRSGVTGLFFLWKQGSFFCGNGALFCGNGALSRAREVN